MKHKILVALDGSEESLVTAWLLKKQGHLLRAVMFDVSTQAENKEQLKQQVQDIERKLGVPVQLMECAQEAREIVGREIDFAKARNSRFDVKSIFDQKFLFPKLFAMKAHFQFEKIATGHRVNLQFEPLENRVKVVLYQPRDEDESHLLLSLEQDELRSLEFPLGAIPMAMIRKLASELQLGAGFQPMKFEYHTEHLDEIELIEKEVANAGTDSALEIESFNPSVIFGVQNPNVASELEQISHRSISEVWLEAACWFSGKDLGLSSLHCQMSWSESAQSPSVKVMQYEGAGLKAILDQPLMGEAANLFPGDQVMWLEGDTVLGGARVVRCL